MLKSRLQIELRDMYTHVYLLEGVNKCVYKTHMIEVTREAKNEAFKYARAVPAERAEWKPIDQGRSVLDICQEMAMCPLWAVDIIQGTAPEWNEESMAAITKEKEQWKTIADCEAECDRRLAKLEELFKGMDDSRLAEKKWLPYDGGRDFSMREMMAYPHWNFTYHTGQIAYIQTLYGDKEMH